MKILSRLSESVKEFLHSIYKYPSEFFLCILCFVICVLLVESPGHEEKLPVVLLYIPATFAVIFSIRNGWKPKSKWTTICYYGSILLPFIPCCFFNYSDFDKSVHFGVLTMTGTYLLAALLVVSVRWQKDNRLFVADAKNYCFALGTAAVFTGILSAVYYALVGSFFFLIIEDCTEDFFFRLCFVHMGLFISTIIFPMLFCYFAAKGEAIKEKKLNLSEDFVVGKIISPALICYTAILYLYAAKILITWNLPKGGLTIMVIVFLSIALYVNSLRPFAQKERFGWFFKYLPYLSIVPLVMYWIATCRRISDYGLTQPRVFLVAFGALITLFMIFMVIKSLNKYLLMSCISAVVIFFLTLMPPTSARQIAINSQYKIFDAVLAQYPIYDVKSNKFKKQIPRDCLTDTLAIQRFMSAYDYLCCEDILKRCNTPDEIYRVIYNYGNEYAVDSAVVPTAYYLNEPINLTEYPYFIGTFYIQEFPIETTDNKTLVKSISFKRISESVKANIYTDEDGNQKIKGIAAFTQKTDETLAVWTTLECEDTFEIRSINRIELFAKHPYKVKGKE